MVRSADLKAPIIEGRMLRIAAQYSLAVVLAFGCSQSRSPDDAVIKRVAGGLRPPIAVTGRPPIRWQLVERMAELHIPGVSIAVIDRGRIVWARGFGVKQAGTTDSVTTATLFQAASISKLVTATAMLRLVDAGQLELDVPVRKYLRSWKLPENRFTAIAPVTLRRLASHSAGINGAGFLGYTLGDSIPSLPQVLSGEPPANSSPVVVDTVPGAMFRYASGGTLITQQVLIDVTGESFPALMKRWVLQPLGMQLSTFDQPLPDSRRAEAASGHNQDGTMMRGRWPVHPEMAAGGLWTTATELAKFAIAITDAWAGRSRELLSHRTAQEMLTVQKAPLGIGPFLEGEGKAFRFSHSGSNRGFRGELVMFPNVGQGAVVLTNGDRGGLLIDEIFQAIAAEYGWPAYQQTERSVVALPDSQLDGLVGTYELPAREVGPGVRAIVSHEGSSLFLTVPPFLPKLEFEPQSADSFFSLTGSTMVFHRDDTGRGASLRLGQTEAIRVR